MNLHDRSGRQRYKARFVTVPLATDLAASAQVANRLDVIGITDCGHRRLHTVTSYTGDLPVNRFSACLFSPALLVFLVLAAAVQPAIAQQDQAKHIFHRLIPAGDTCSTCHKVVWDQWKASPHAANGVECTVCHGETTSRDFAGTPA